MTDNTSDIVPAIADNADWVSIINTLTEQLAKEDLPEKVVKAVELMLAGTPNYKIARKLNVSQQTIRSWFQKYPIIAHIVVNGKALLSKWRLSQLEQQFFQAIERSEEVLGIELSGNSSDGEGIDPKVLTVVAAQSRYIIGLFAGQKIDVTVTHELGDTVMKARNDALDYISAKLAEEEEPVEVTYRVIDPRVDNLRPLLTEDGKPFHGEFGKLDITDDGCLCHICGERRRDFSKHVQMRHAMPNDEYELTYLLENGAVAKADKSY